jgi:phosphate uptake regulator
MSNPFKGLFDSLNTGHMSAQQPVPAAMPHSQIDPEVQRQFEAAAKAHQLAEKVQSMAKDAERAKMLAAQVARDVTDLLKGFSPTALAKVIARDAELHDLITKAQFLVPAYLEEKTDDPSSAS